MRLERTLNRIAAGDLRRAARDLGYELPRCRVEVMAQFRTALAALAAADDDLARWAEPILDVVAAYQMAIEGTESPAPRALFALSREPLSVSTVSLLLGVSLATASRDLASLEKAGMARSFVPHYDGRRRMYTLTDEGRRRLARFPNPTPEPEAT